MTKLSYLLAAAAAIAIASPAFAQDAPKAGAGVSINQGATSGGEVKRDSGRSQEGRGESRREGDRAQGGMEVRGDRREGMRGEIRGERREGLRGEVRGERRVARTGINVTIGERERYRERRWHRARAERVVIIKHRRHRHYGHHHHHHGM